jgi:hypothetical protein
MTYENAEIQKAIDNTIIAQQLKVVNEARFVAQRRENDRIELEANATAERARWIAAGKADAKGRGSSRSGSDPGCQPRPGGSEGKPAPQSAAVARGGTGPDRSLERSIPDLGRGTPAALVLPPAPAVR